jgi:hypothetical protein
MLRLRPVVFATVCVVSLGAVACAGHTSAAKRVSTATTSPGARPVIVDLTTFTDQADHFSLGLPKTWQRVSVSSPRAQARLAQLATDNPRLTTLGNFPTLVAKGVKLLAVNPFSTLTYAEVAVESAPGAPSQPTTSDLNDVYPTLASGMQKVGGVIEAHHIKSMSGQNVLEIRYHVPLNLSGSSLTEHGVVDVVVAKDTIYAITLIGNSPLLSQIASSFTVLNP